MRSEIGPAGFRHLRFLRNELIVDRNIGTIESTIDVLGGTLNVAFNVQSETRRFGYCQPEVECDAGRNTSEADEETPGVIDVSQDFGIVCKNGALVSSSDNKTNKGSSYV